MLQSICINWLKGHETLELFDLARLCVPNVEALLIYAERHRVAFRFWWRVNYKRELLAFNLPSN